METVSRPHTERPHTERPERDGAERPERDGTASRRNSIRQRIIDACRLPDASQDAPPTPSPHALSRQEVARLVGDTPSRAWLRGLALMGGDIVSLLAGVGAATLAANYVWGGGPLSPLAYQLGTASVVLTIFAYAAAGLYNAISPSLAEEIRIQGLTTTAVFGSLALGALLLLNRAYLSLAYLGPAWILALLAVPLGRSLLRRTFAERPWWGCPVVVLGAGTVGRHAVRALLSQPERGLRPIALLDDDPELHGQLVGGVPVAGPLDLATDFSMANVPYGIVALSGREGERLVPLLERHASGFSSVLVVPDLLGMPSRWTRAREVGDGIVGLEMHRRLLSPWRQRLKRAFDVTATLAALTMLFPLGLLIAVLIKLDSPGSIFYCQDRMGKNGRPFQVYKFRSMHEGADRRLQEVLDSDPEARAEYEHYQKLQNDPRVTRIGRLLRKTSLDELPQLLNVLEGSMSLVGPRAYLPREVPKMERQDYLILRARPGLTGLWQVSGRNDLSFEARVDLDVQYVRNWSFFLDLSLMVRTVPVVLLGRGAQ